MLPDFSVLIGLILGFWSLQPGMATSPQRALLGTALCLLVGGAASRMSAQRGRRAVQEEDPLAAVASARWTTWWPLIAWIAALYIFEWGGLVHDQVPRMTWLVRYVILLAPAAILFAVGWSARWEVESALITMHGGVPGAPTARAAVRSGFRRNAAAFLPLFALIAITDGLWVVGQLGVEPLRVASRWLDHMPLLNLCVFLGLMLLALPFFPRWIARMLGAQPLPDDALRARLEAGAEAIGLHVGHILVWPTQRRILNAMVVGVTRRSRTIILSDRIIADLPEEELMAVFFHEAGHAKLQHLTLYLVMFFTLVGLIHIAEEDLLLAGIGPGWILFLQLALFWFVILGSISRRFEREADIYGADHAAVLDEETAAAAPGMALPISRGAALMMRALDRVRQSAGAHVPSHRHGTLEDRISYIGAYATDPQVRTSFVRTRRTLRLGIAIALVVGIAGIATKWPTELRRAEAGMAKENGDAAVERAEALAKTGARTAAQTEWKQAHTAYLSAAKMIGEDPRNPGDAFLLTRLHRQSADIALDELNDIDGARVGFKLAERGLKQLEEQPAIDSRLMERVRFLTWVGSARVAAREQRFDVADDYLARAVRSEQRLSVSSETSEGLRSWYAEILRLARASVNGHAATAAAVGGSDALRLARRRLRQLAGGQNPARQWVSLREAAKRELESLPVLPDEPNLPDEPE